MLIDTWKYELGEGSLVMPDEDEQCRLYSQDSSNVPYYSIHRYK